MPNRPLRPCAGGCGSLVPKGRCATCARKVEQRRGSASARGYDSHWERFRTRFVHMLLEEEILPVCGAALPTGPHTQDSLCKADGMMNGDDLHLDHEPPLQDWERQHPERVCDPNRIQLLCGGRCHVRKTHRQTHAMRASG